MKWIVFNALNIIMLLLNVIRFCIEVGDYTVLKTITLFILIVAHSVLVGIMTALIIARRYL
jgi:hypothetical protein